MFKQMKTWFWGSDPGKDKRVGENVQQAYLSQQIVNTLDVALKLDLKVTIQISVGGRQHAMRVPGKNNPIVEALRDLAEANMLEAYRRMDMELKIRDLNEARPSGRRPYDAV